MQRLLNPPHLSMWILLHHFWQIFNVSVGGKEASNNVILSQTTLLLNNGL